GRHSRRPGVIQFVSRGTRLLGQAGSNAFHRRAQHGTKPHAEAAEVDAPPEHAQRYADWVAVRYEGAEDAPTRPKHDPAERKADDAIESTREGARIRGSLPNVRVDSIMPIPTSCGRGRTTCLARISQGRCSGHEILLCGQPGR